MIVLAAGYGWHNSGECGDKELWQGGTHARRSSLASAQCKNEATDCRPENAAWNVAV